MYKQVYNGECLALWKEGAKIGYLVCLHQGGSFLVYVIPQSEIMEVNEKEKRR